MLMMESQQSGPQDSKRGMTRREFLAFAGKGSAAVALISVAPSSVGALANDQSAANERLQRLGRSSFKQHEGERFIARQGAYENVDLTLVSVADAGPASGEETFSAVFEGPSGTPLAQKTYFVEHPAMGTFPLFLVPTYGKPGTATYEAVFNRMAG